MLNTALFLLVLIPGTPWPAGVPEEHQGAASGTSFEQRKLAQLPEDSTLDRCVFSPDGRRLAYVAGRPGQQVAVIDGARGPSFASILELNFSADGHRVYYLALETPRSDHAVLFVDGKPLDAIDPVAGSIRFSPDGNHLAYVGKDKGGQRVVLDGIPGSFYPFVGAPRFSADSRTLGYVAGMGPRWTAVVDGKEGTRFDSISPTITFSQDARKWGYVGSLDQKSSVVIDGAVPFTFSAQKVGPLFLSRDGGTYAFPFVEPSGRQSVVVDGTKQQAFDGISGLTLSPSGKRIGYHGIRSGKPPNVSAVIDGSQGREFDDLWDIRFSADDARVAYMARTGNQYVLVVDGKAGAAMEGDPTFDPLFQTGQIAFSQDGKRLAYFFHKSSGEGIVVVNGKEGKNVSQLLTPLAFNPEGTRLAFGAALGAELWWVVLPLP